MEKRLALISILRSLLVLFSYTENETVGILIRVNTMLRITVCVKVYSCVWCFLTWPSSVLRVEEDALSSCMVSLVVFYLFLYIKLILASSNPE